MQHRGLESPASRVSFRVAAVGLDHNHIFGMAQGLTEAGASLDLVLIPIQLTSKYFGQSFPRLKRPIHWMR